MAKQRGGTAVLEKEEPVAETLARRTPEKRPLTIAWPGPLPLKGKSGPLGKWIGQGIDLMLEGQTQIEIERVVVHIHLKDPEAWED